LSNSNPSLPSWLRYFAVLGGWAASILLSVIDVWSIQNAVVKVAVWAGSLRSAGEQLGPSYGWTVETISMTSLLVLLCAVVGFEVWVEYYYRRGATLGLLAKRILGVSIIQGIIAIVGTFVIVIF
jgi:hypothetical protein